MKTKAKVGESVRIHTKIPSKFGKGMVRYDGLIHEISHKKSKNPFQKLFKNGYVILSGSFTRCTNGRFSRTAKRKIGLDAILRITKKLPKEPRNA